MANLPETEDFADSTYQIETSDRVLGGPGGIANKQAEQLGNRTAWLKAAIAKIIDGTTAVGKATQLAASQTLKFKGAVSGSGSYDGTSDTEIALTLADTGVAAGTYTKVTINVKGLVTGANSPTTLAGYGITDVFTKPETTSAIQQAISSLVGSSPVALDTLNELAAALGNDANFATTVTNALATKMPTTGGPYYPLFSGMSVKAEVRGYNGSGGHIGWGADASGTLQFICNKGNGNTGGFSWWSVNADNQSLGPAMTYSPAGLLTVPTALAVPALTGNTTVLTQGEGYAGTYAANCAFVSTAVSRKVTGDFADAVGFASNDATRPWIRQKSTGLVVELRSADVKDTALLAASGWSKNTDTGEIKQWFEYNQGDVPGSSVINITWPFQFPNQFLNARFSFKMPNSTTPCLTQASYSSATISGCTVRLEEWGNAAQAGLVLVIEARGK